MQTEMNNNPKIVTLRRLGTADYGVAWDLQKKLFSERQQGLISDQLILCEHPPTYTIGRDGVTTASEHLLLNREQLNARGISVYEIDRGGDITYHGPGQLVGYPILDLNGYYRDAHRYLRDLEEIIIRTLAGFDIHSRRFPPHTGVWVDSKNGPEKICAIGVKISRWITMHGFALNVNTDLSYFGGIVPCGIREFGVTSIAKQKNQFISMSDVEQQLIPHFSAVFNVQTEVLLHTEPCL